MLGRSLGKEGVGGAAGVNQINSCLNVNTVSRGAGGEAEMEVIDSGCIWGMS